MKVMEERHCIGLLEKAELIRDVEKAHMLADEALLDFLQKLGYFEVVKKFNKVTKYYG